MVLLRRSVRKIQFVMAKIKNSLWTEPLSFQQKPLLWSTPCQKKSYFPQDFILIIIDYIQLISYSFHTFNSLRLQFHVTCFLTSSRHTILSIRKWFQAALTIWISELCWCSESGLMINFPPWSVTFMRYYDYFLRPLEVLCICNHAITSAIFELHELSCDYELIAQWFWQLLLQEERKLHWKFYFSLLYMFFFCCFFNGFFLSQNNIRMKTTRSMFDLRIMWKTLNFQFWRNWRLFKSVIND